LEVTEQGDDLRLTNTIRSTGVVSAFFKIDDRTESVITRAGRPKFFRENKKEGSYRARREATFDFTKLRADSVDLLKKIEKTDPITAKTYDNLSSIYFIRSIDLVPGQSIYFDIYDTKRLWNSEVRVVKRQVITTPLGRFKTVMVTSQLKHKGEIRQGRQRHLLVYRGQPTDTGQDNHEAEGRGDHADTGRRNPIEKSRRCGICHLAASLPPPRPLKGFSQPDRVPSCSRPVDPAPSPTPHESPSHRVFCTLPHPCASPAPDTWSRPDEVPAG